MPKDYHCCATCQHFRIVHSDGQHVAMCARLGYETRTYYQFNCWDPRPDIRRKMAEQAREADPAPREAPAAGDPAPPASGES